MMDFEMILKLPQAELKDALTKELQNNGYTITSKDGFLYAPGSIPVLLVAHLDTVHQCAPEIICYPMIGVTSCHRKALVEMIVQVCL